MVSARAKEARQKKTTQLTRGEIGGIMGTTAGVATERHWTGQGEKTGGLAQGKTKTGRRARSLT